MKEKHQSGYKEIEHTADIALNVWAPDLQQLFIESAKGMLSLMEIQVGQERRESHSIVLQDKDCAILLVEYLSEILYLVERERLGFFFFEVLIEGNKLVSEIIGSSIISQRKEIKAVTFHDLEIISEHENCRVTIVFDV
jgi:SHS2 domain-containing protein